MVLKTGNYTELTIGPLCDETGATINYLASAENVIFVLKKNATDTNEDADVYVDPTSGMTVNSPSIGYIKVVLNSDDMVITPGKYFIAVQVNVSNTQKIEVDLYENGQLYNTVNVIQDIIR